MKKLIFAITLLSGISFTQSAHAQLNFTTDKFSKIETNLTDLNVSEVDDLGFTFPLDERIEKYDKVIAVLFFKELGVGKESFTRFNNASAVFFPKSETFKDNYSDKKDMNIYLINPDSEKITTLTSKKNYTSASPYAYTMVVEGYFLKGTETVWNERREAFETKNVYTYSKDIYTSSEITFAPSQEAIDKVNARKQIEAQFDEYNKIHEELMAYIAPGHRILAARCYNPSEHNIKSQKSDSYANLDSESIAELIELENKFLEIFKNKKAKNLLLKIDKLSDYEEIKKAVFDF